MLADVAVAKGRRWEHLVRSWEHPSNHEQASKCNTCARRRGRPGRWRWPWRCCCPRRAAAASSSATVPRAAARGAPLLLPPHRPRAVPRGAAPPARPPARRAFPRCAAARTRCGTTAWQRETSGRCVCACASRAPACACAAAAAGGTPVTCGARRPVCGARGGGGVRPRQMATDADDLNDNVTMLQQRDWPHLVVCDGAAARARAARRGARTLPRERARVRPPVQVQGRGPLPPGRSSSSPLRSRLPRRGGDGGCGCAPRSWLASAHMRARVSVRVDVHMFACVRLRVCVCVCVCVCACVRAWWAHVVARTAGGAVVGK
jgi:hypothetical protein